MSATTDIAIKTTCVAVANDKAMVAILATEDAGCGRAAGTVWTVVSALRRAMPATPLGVPVPPVNAPEPG